MVARLKAVPLLVVLIATSLVGCGIYDSPPAPPPPPPSPPGELNFEGTEFTTWKSAGAYTYDDASTVVNGVQGITFSQDTANAKAGSASLKISGTMQKNKYGDDYISDARIYLHSDKTTVVDFTARTITVNFLVQTGSANKLQVILNDSGGQGCQGKYITSSASSGWQTVTFTPSDSSQRNYCSPSFDITKVAFVEVRIADQAATSSSQVVWNVDSISWASTPPPPPPPSDLAQLNFEGTQVTTWSSAGAYAYDDPSTVESGSQAITFSQDTAHAKAGLASLQIAGTMLKNKWGTDYISDARIYLNADKTVVDFSTKTITVDFLVQTGTANKVMVILNDSAYQPCQGKPIDSIASSGWQTVTFTPSDASQINYKSGTFDITKVAFVEVRIADQAATSSSQVVWNVDSISW